jgi:hypothetical protein
MSGKVAAVPTEIAYVCEDQAETSMLFEPAAAVTTVDDILRQKKSTRILAVRMGETPDGLCVGLVGLAVHEKYYVRLHAWRVENARWQSQDGVEVAELHHPCT